ncbi:JAB domain-containing protein [Bacillus cereus]|nr:JAB domain-containing protein [Bacillus cereus]
MQTVYEVLRIKQERVEVKGIKIPRITSSEIGANMARQFIGDEDREVFFIACLNTQLEVMAVHRVHVGTLHYSVVSMRDVFKTAILNNSYSIMAFHNHPSNSPFPSDADYELTKQLLESGSILGIPLLDHVIVTEKGHYSFKVNSDLF